MPGNGEERSVRLLFIADIVGEPGLDVLARLLPALIEERNVHFVVVNGENADEGRGMTVEQVEVILDLGADVITSGNHIWDKHALRKKMKRYSRLLRPANYPDNAGGFGYHVRESRNGVAVAVINLQGRMFLPAIDCPFRKADRLTRELSEKATLIFIDIHAESTAEKIALGRFLDGRISGMAGTHTHVQTADEQILPKGTGYITDAGMTGPSDSIIGMSVRGGIKRFLTRTPHTYKLAKGEPRLNGVLYDFDVESGKCLHIERINLA